MKIIRCALPRLWTAALLFCAPIFAQEVPTYTIRVNTDLVQIRVVARDHDGRFVPDLTSDDFELMEDGRPQQLSAVDLETVGRGPASQPFAPLSILNPAASTSSGTAAGLRLVVLFFDFTSLDIADAARSLGAAEKYIRTIGPADRVAVVTLAPTLEVRQDFTRDRDELQRALDGLRGLSQAVLETADDPSYTLFRGYTRLHSLRVLAGLLGKVPQKKSVVIFAGGSGSEGGNALISSVIGAAVRAGVAFYGIDAGGLAAVPPLGDASRASSFGTGVLSGVAVTRSVGSSHEQTLLYALAQGTGGRSFFDSNDFERPFRIVEADSGEYYVLSYYSSNSRPGSPHRRISVRVRRRGIELKYQGSYDAPPDSVPMSAKETERLITAELAGDAPRTGVPVYGFVNHVRVGRDSYFLPITVLVPADALLSNGVVSSATVGIAVMDSRGRPVRKLHGVIPASAVSGQTGGAARFDTAVELPSGEYNLRVAVVQSGTAQVGSFRTPIRLPKPSRSRLSVSPLLTGMLSAVPAGAAHSPLDVNGSRLVLSPAPAYREDRDFTVQYQVECGSERSPEAGAGCDPGETRSALQCFSSDVAVLQAAPAESTTAGDAAVFRVNLAAGALRAGTYTCRVTAVNTPAAAFAFGSMQLRIVETARRESEPPRESNQF